MKKKIFNRVTRCILYFVICSFIGWLYEIAAGFLIWGEYDDRGILSLPLCPIYGFGALLLIAVFHRKNSVLTVLVSGVAACTALELLVSYGAERFLGTQLWTYEHWPLQYQGRISLISSLIFGVFSVIAVKVVWPLLKRIVQRIPVWCNVLMDIILLLSIGTDAVVSLTALYHG